MTATLSDSLINSLINLLSNSQSNSLSDSLSNSVTKMFVPVNKTTTSDRSCAGPVAAWSLPRSSSARNNAHANLQISKLVDKKMYQVVSARLIV